MQTGKGKSTAQVKSSGGMNKGDGSFVNYDLNVNRESESEIQDKFYQTQKVGTSMFS